MCPVEKERCVTLSLESVASNDRTLKSYIHQHRGTILCLGTLGEDFKTPAGRHWQRLAVFAI